MGPNQTYKLLHSKETINKTKRQPTEWEEILTNDVTNKGLIFKIYKQRIQLNKRPNPKMGRRPKYTFLQRRHTDGQQAHEMVFHIALY